MCCVFWRGRGLKFTVMKQSSYLAKEKSTESSERSNEYEYYRSPYIQIFLKMSHYLMKTWKTCHVLSPPVFIFRGI